MAVKRGDRRACQPGPERRLIRTVGPQLCQPQPAP